MNHKEYQTIVYEWNKTKVPYLKNKTIHQLFEEQVERTPDKIAVVFEDKHLTYRELNEKANQLTHTLRKKYYDIWGQNIESDTLIGIYTERSQDMVIGILGILKSRAAYVPFTRTDPEERVRFKINDCGCKMVLTRSMNVTNLLSLSETDMLPFAMDSYSEEIEKAPKDNPCHINKPTALAYVIYTSGSTGNPKGVMIEHRSVINLLESLAEVYDYDEEHFKSTLFTSYAFDISVAEIFIPLTRGKELYIFPEKLKISYQEMADYIEKHKIGYLFLTPALLAMLPKRKYKSLKTIIYGGEPCNLNTAEYWCKKKKLFNLYGPTETTVCSTRKQIMNGEAEVIGKPILNTKIYVLDKNLTPVNVGVQGELYIGGDGLSRGYLNRPELTKEKFINNPFSTNEDKVEGRNLRLYKSGDLVKWLPDGNLVYIGRNDDQVKIRGFRIELGEIESKLSEYPGIEQCAVTVKKREKNKYLAAYYTLQSSSCLHKASSRQDAAASSLQAPGRDEFQSTIRKFLSAKLPDYMVPTFFIKLKKMPLNTSGKIDRKALPKPDISTITSEAYTAPRNKQERKFCKIWQDILGIKRIGMDDNFFHLGGNSLMIVKMLSILQQEFEIKIEAEQVFTHPTIAAISSFIKSKNLKLHENVLNLAYKDFELAKKEIDNLPSVQKNVNAENPEGVLLTGASGFLGIYLLDYLLKNTNADIYCLLRGKDDSDIREKLLKNLKVYQKEKLIKNPKLKLLIGDLTKKHLGLPCATIKKIESKVDAIYHNAAFVHHIYSYSMLRAANTLSLIELLKLSLTPKRPKALHFISTIATIEPTINAGLLKRTKFEPPPSTNGYTLSKWVSEKISLYAAQTKDLPVAIYRPGNITGNSQRGYSNYQQNHILLVLKGCIQMGVAPNFSFPIELTPVDILAQTIVKLSLLRDVKGKSYNLDNPIKTTINEYFKEAKRYGFKLESVSLKRWREKYLNKINESNAMYALKELYLNKSPNNMGTPTPSRLTLETQKQLKSMSISYPSNYPELIKIYVRYLKKERFL